MIRALIARAITTLTSAIFSILTARLLLGTAGIEQFALYSLITTLPALVQFTDLGSGAAIVNVVASSPDPRGDEKVTVTVTSVGRILLMFALAVMVVDTVMFASGLWERVLGEAGRLPGAPLAAFVCFATFALTIPLSLWQRVLLGLQRNHLTILLQGLLAPLNLLFAWLILASGAEHQAFLAMASYLAAFAVAFAGTLVASGILPSAIPVAMRRILRPRRFPGVRVMDVGWPMLVQMLSAPLSIASQRYVLAQFEPTAVIAEYTTASQVFSALLGVITAAGVALWPLFMKQRAAGELKRGPFVLSLYFGAVTMVAVIGIALVRDPLFGFTSNGKVEVGLGTVGAFGLMVLMQACLYPLGMFIMDRHGIRFQMVPTGLMALGSLVLSILVTPLVGLTGPILANCLCVAGCQIIPFSLYIRRNRARLWAPTE
jgi:O-antigen/teichoic acid export membrane protein